MAWTESGLYVDNIQSKMMATAAYNIDLRLTTSKLPLYNNTDTPDFTATNAAYSATNEVTDASNWTAGGRLVSSAASGGASIAPACGKSGDSKSFKFSATDISVANCTISGIMGMKWQFDASTPKWLLLGIYFPSGPYSPSAGTFAITWAAAGIFVVKCVPSGA